MTDPVKEIPKIIIPMPLLIVHALAMVGIGISLVEIFSEKGRSLGLLSIDDAWTAIWVCGVVAASTTIKILLSIIQQKRDIQSGTSNIYK